MCKVLWICMLINGKVFKKSIQSNLPLGINPEASKKSGYDMYTHNIILSYAYVLLLAAHGKKQFKLLDWGGGIGHYGIISEELLKPTNSVVLDYHCYDLPLYCKAGRQT